MTKKVKNISIEEIWNKFEKKFKIDEEIDFFTLSSLLRVIIEKEKLQSKIEDLHYSIIHQFLHWESIRSDKSMYLISIINILEKLPEKYDCESIKNQILKNIPQEYDFFKIFNYGKPVKKKYKLIITNFSFFSYQEKIFFYTGKIADIKNDKRITFISRNKFTLRDIYNFSFQYVTINYGANIFMETKNENFSLIIREKIHDQYSISNYYELISLLNSKKWPSSWELMSERKLLSDIYLYLTSMDKKSDLGFFYPFLCNPYIAKISLRRKSIDEIISSYNIDKDDEMKIIKDKWKIEKDWKINMEKNNLYYLEVDKHMYENFSWKSNYFIKKDNEETFLIQYKTAKKDYEIFQKLFESNGKDIKDRKAIRIISENDLNIWKWKGEDEGKTSKKIIHLLKSQGLLILLGPAGHGKTFSLNEIIDLYLSKKLIVKLICPTWKSISLFKDKIESSTVEKRNRSLDDNFFDDVDLLIIDEISLIWEWNFLSKIKSTTQIIFAGDINQLGPLNKDSKFRKHEWLLKIATKKKIIDLKKEKNYRISNLPPDHDGKYILKNLLNEELNFKNHVKNINCFYSIEETILKLIELSEKNYTVITQFNGGMWGVDFLNRLLRNGYSEKFEIGEKIIFIKTDVPFKNIDGHTKPNYYIGLFGEIIDIQLCSVDSKKYIIKTDHGKEIKIYSNDDEISNIIEHSYVMNAYKAQGSTIENVVVLSPSRVDYDWLYTAASRFSKNIEIIFIAGSFEYIKFGKRIKN